MKADNGGLLREPQGGQPVMAHCLWVAPLLHPNQDKRAAQNNPPERVTGTDVANA